ncbi:hypothetical protein EV385_3011 [Krasilnikovia cinnamomea]|uniref:Uncharacterized protein n=1 Tax=Krasilnikovia cinnamomea TaxID=349313 RepID=A0A4Q7ZLG4_9ACTN|nr:hypothetical protein [Krasilnikovia cinnamomea]RZU51203.1 hypothetical protein EV385_3011 [Krasilnikovia cinnamomea]
MATHYGGRELLATLTPCGELRKAVAHDDDWGRVTCRGCWRWVNAAWRNAPASTVEDAQDLPSDRSGASEDAEQRPNLAALTVELAASVTAARNARQVGEFEAVPVATGHADGGDGTMSMVCLVCNRSLQDNGMSARPAQPRDGVIVTVRGNYGSTVYDSMGGSYLVSYLCDPCILSKGGDQMISEVEELPAAEAAVKQRRWLP